MKELAVYVVTYNRCSLLRKTLKSILDQSFSNFDLIVLDNASNDNTSKVVDEFQDSRITYIKHDKNIGGIENINYAFFHAIKSHYKYFIVFHDDDTMEHEFINEELNCITSNDDIAVVCTGNNNINCDDKYIKKYKSTNLIRKFSGLDLFNYYMKYIYTNLPFPSFMYRTSFIKKQHIVLQEQSGPCCDILLALDVLRMGGIIFKIEKGLINSRLHQGQDSEVSNGFMHYQLFEYLIHSQYYRNLILNSTLKNRYYCVQARIVLRNLFKGKTSIKIAQKSFNDLSNQLMPHNCILYLYKFFFDCEKKFCIGIKNNF